MIIHEIQKLEHPFHVQPGDEIRLYIKELLVSAKPITEIDYVTHWARVELPGAGIGYFVGNENLEKELKKL